MNRIWSGTIGMLLLIVAAVSVTRAQAPAPARASAPAAPEDAVAALVTEVRALRTELSQLAGASVRSQLIVTRIQLQEQRLLHLDRQRTEVAAKLADAEKMNATFATQLKMFETPGPQVPQAERDQMGKMVEGMKAQLQAAQASENALRTEQNNLLNAIATEQSRWNDFNGRLDDLERSLPAANRR